MAQGTQKKKQKGQDTANIRPYTENPAYLLKLWRIISDWKLSSNLFLYYVASVMNWWHPQSVRLGLIAWVNYRANKKIAREHRQRGSDTRQAPQQEITLPRSVSISNSSLNSPNEVDRKSMQKRVWVSEWVVTSCQEWVVTSCQESQNPSSSGNCCFSSGYEFSSTKNK